MELRSPTDPDGSPNLGWGPAKGRLLPSHRTTTTWICAMRCRPTCPERRVHLERGHHEVGTGGQAEINYKFNTPCTRPTMCCCSGTSSRTPPPGRQDRHVHALPLFGDNGSGMHPPVMEGTVSRCSTTSRATRVCRIWLATTSARHPAPRPVAAGVHPTRPSTRTSALVPAARP